jgi:hypothetical protein
MAGGVFIAIALCSLAGSTALAQASTPARLQPLVNDAVAQLKISYRHDSVEREARYEAIGQAVSAWNKSNRDQADNDRLAEWLRAAMRASMPGSHEAMPALPKFGPIPSETATKKAPNATTPQTLRAPAAGSQSSDNANVVSETPTSESHARENSVDTSRGQTREVQKPITADEGDPFRDDPLPIDN